MLDSIIMLYLSFMVPLIVQVEFGEAGDVDINTEYADMSTITEIEAPGTETATTMVTEAVSALLCTGCNHKFESQEALANHTCMPGPDDDDWSDNEATGDGDGGGDGDGDRGGDGSVEKEQFLQCPFCPRMFHMQWISSFYEHMSKAHASHQGEVEVQVVQMKKAANPLNTNPTGMSEASDKEIKEDAQCPICAIHFKQRKNLPLHLINLHKMSVDAIQEMLGADFLMPVQYSCPLCDQKYTSVHFLKKHLLSHTDKGTAKKEDIQKDSTKYFQCLYCKLITRYACSIRKHVTRRHPAECVGISVEKIPVKKIAAEEVPASMLKKIVSLDKRPAEIKYKDSPVVYRCPFCKYITHLPSNLSRHLTSKAHDHIFSLDELKVVKIKSFLACKSDPSQLPELKLPSHLAKIVNEKREILQLDGLGFVCKKKSMFRSQKAPHTEDSFADEIDESNEMENEENETLDEEELMNSLKEDIRTEQDFAGTKNESRDSIKNSKQNIQGTLSTKITQLPQPQYLLAGGPRKDNTHCQTADGTCATSEFVKCLQCPLRFSSVESLLEHIVMHKNIVVNFSCLICKLKFPFYSKLLEHDQTAHQGRKTTNVMKSISMSTVKCSERPVTAYDCPYCEMLFSKQTSLEQHVKMDHREHLKSPGGLGNNFLGYNCYFCELSFKTVLRLVEHMQAVHPNAKKPGDEDASPVVSKSGRKRKLPQWLETDMEVGDEVKRMRTANMPVRYGSITLLGATVKNLGESAARTVGEIGFGETGDATVKTRDIERTEEEESAKTDISTLSADKELGILGKQRSMGANSKKLELDSGKGDKSRGISLSKDDNADKRELEMEEDELMAHDADQTDQHDSDKEVMVYVSDGKIEHSSKKQVSATGRGRWNRVPKPASPVKKVENKCTMTHFKTVEPEGIKSVRKKRRKSNKSRESDIMNPDNIVNSPSAKCPHCSFTAKRASALSFHVRMNHPESKMNEDRQATEVYHKEISKDHLLDVKDVDVILDEGNDSEQDSVFGDSDLESELDLNEKIRRHVRYANSEKGNEGQVDVCEGEEVCEVTVRDLENGEYKVHYECPYCQCEAFSTPAIRARHIKKHHLHQLHEFETGWKQRRGKKHRCPVCSIVFENLKYVLKHLKTHKGSSEKLSMELMAIAKSEHVLKCSLCNVISLDIDTITRHMELDHPSDSTKEVIRNVYQMPTPDTTKIIAKYRCPYCPYKVQHTSALYRHQRRKHKHEKCVDVVLDGVAADLELMSGDYPCPYCKEKFDSPETVVAHSQEYHPKKGELKLADVKTEEEMKTNDMYGCPFCAMTSQYTTSVTRHVARHHPEKRRQFDPSMIVHRITGADQKFSCDHCDFQTEYKTSLYQHVQRKHPDEFEDFKQDQSAAPIRGESGSKGLVSRRLKTLKPLDEDVTRQFLCTSCMNVFDDFRSHVQEVSSCSQAKYVLVLQMRSVNNVTVYSCPVCNFEDFAANETVQHLQQHDNPETESITPRPTPVKRKRGRPSKAKKTVELTPDTKFMYMCQLCKQCFVDMCLLLNHHNWLHSHTKVEFQRVLIGQQPVKMAYSCPLCTFTSLKQSQVTKHLTRDHADKQWSQRDILHTFMLETPERKVKNTCFQCTKCGIFFKDINNMSFHMQFRHSLVKTHCKLVKDAASLANIRGGHLRVRCGACRRTFGSRITLQWHARREHGGVQLGNDQITMPAITPTDEQQHLPKCPGTDCCLWI